MDSDEFTYEESLKDRLAGFFSDPSKDSFIEIVDEIDETDYLECKGEWIDEGALAKHLLAMSNTEGGAIILGVSQNEDGTLEPTGLDEFLDAAKLGDGLEKYIPDSIRPQYRLKNYSYNPEAYPEVADKMFQVIFVETNDFKIPFVSLGGTTGINPDTIYTRRDTKSVRANYSEINGMIERRLNAVREAPSRELSEELDELEVLYDKLDEKIRLSQATAIGLQQRLSDVFKIDNPRYPDEDFKSFVKKLIFKKKLRIERMLQVEDIDTIWESQE